MAESKEPDAQQTMDDARKTVMTCETEIQSIKSALRSLTSSEEEQNTVRISALKIEGEHDPSSISIHLQLSSPIEERTITSLFDPLANTTEEISASVVSFQAVEVAQAFLGITLNERYTATTPLDLSDLLEFNAVEFLGKCKVSTVDVDLENVDKGTNVNGPSVDEAKDSGDTNEPSVDKGDELAANQTAESVAKDSDAADTEKDADKDAEESAVKKDVEQSVDKEQDSEKDADASAVKSNVDTTEVETSGESISSAEEKDEIAKVEILAEEETDTAESVKSADEVVETTEDETSAEIKTNAETEKDETEKVEISAEKEMDTAESVKSADEVVETTEVVTSAEIKTNADKEKDETAEVEISAEEKTDTIESVKPAEEVTTEKAPQVETEKTAANAAEDTKPKNTKTVVTFKLEYEPSSKDRQEKLYELLNASSRKKAQAIESLRKSAAAVTRARPKPTTMATADGSAVKAGFLNKKKPVAEPMFLKRWYDRFLGPQSMCRMLFPIAKNYIVFFGAVSLMHFKGHELALPAPV